jgi:hypothetical protein
LGSNAFYYFLDKTAMNKTVSGEAILLKSLQHSLVNRRLTPSLQTNNMNKLNSLHLDSDKNENQRTVTRIFHGLYVVTKGKD